MLSPAGMGSIFLWPHCKMTQGSCPFSLTLQASLLQASGCKFANNEQGWHIPPGIIALNIFSILNMGIQYTHSYISDLLPAF